MHIVAVEPTRSPVLGGGKPGLHAIQGIGASFVPGVLNREIYDELIAVKDEDAIEHDEAPGARRRAARRHLGRRQRLRGVDQVAKRLGAGKRVVTVLPDTGERYLSVNF